MWALEERRRCLSTSAVCRQLCNHEHSHESLPLLLELGPSLDRTPGCQESQLPLQQQHQDRSWLTAPDLLPKHPQTALRSDPS